MTNQEDDKIPPIPPSVDELKPPEREDPFAPMAEAPTFVSTFEHLLKKPGSIIHRLHQPDSGPIIIFLLLASAVCFLVFGGLLGTFRMGEQLWAAPAKVVLGVFFSGLLCLPSLYIFSCLNGLTTRFMPVVGVLVGIVSLTGLLLLGFSPVVWIFSQSTDSKVFMGVLVLVFWVLSFFVGVSLLTKFAKFLGVRDIGYLRVWMAIFLVVTLQMSTSLRPILAPNEEDLFLPTEKKFFLTHWANELDDDIDSARKTPPRQEDEPEANR